MCLIMLCVLLPPASNYTITQLHVKHAPVKPLTGSLYNVHQHAVSGRFLCINFIKDCPVWPSSFTPPTSLLSPMVLGLDMYVKQ